jgi:hypothetical protein
MGMNGDELDRILDAALASYSLQEPRAGLSARVMARVRTDSPSSRRPWLLLAIAAAALACLAITTLHWHSNPRPVVVTMTPPVPAVEPAMPAPLPAQPPLPAPAPRTGRKLPQRERFPSPAPLTPEERVLVAFAQRAPQVALRFAQPDKPLEVEEINIRPLQIDGLSTGEMK